jgi:multiple sugar transport system permease protein
VTDEVTARQQERGAPDAGAGAAVATAQAPPQVTPCRRPGRTLARRRQLTGILLVAPAVTFVAVFFLAPLGLMVWMSFHQWPLLGQHSWIGLGNYRHLLDDSTFLHSLWFTVKYTALVTPILFVIGLALALLVKERRRGVGFFRTTYFMPYVVGFAAAAYLWVFLLNAQSGPIGKVLTDLGIVGSPPQFLSQPRTALFAVTAMVTWKVVGFSMLLLMTGLQSIPDELNEAARVDGAGRRATMWHITLPLLRRTIALTLIFSVVGSFLAFDQFYIMTAGGPQNQTLTVVYWIYNTSFIAFDLGYGAALSLALMLLLLVISGIQLYLLRDTTEF